MADLPRTQETAFPAAIKRVAWGAIIAGAVVALVLQLMLNLLGLAIGLGTIDPISEANPFSGIGVGVGIWFTLSALLSLAAGGFVAGRLAGLPRKADGMIHGFIAWALVTFLSIYLVSSGIGAVVGGAYSTVSQGVETIARTVDINLPAPNLDVDISTDEVEAEVLEILRQSDLETLQPAYLRAEAREAAETLRQAAIAALRSPADAEQELRAAIDRLAQQGRDVIDGIDREAAVNVVVARTDLTREEAQQAVDEYIQAIEQAFQDLRQQAEQFAQTVSQRSEEIAERVFDATSRAALWAFLAMLVGAAAAVAGGAAGTPADLPASPAIRRE